MRINQIDVIYVIDAVCRGAVSARVGVPQVAT